MKRLLLVIFLVAYVFSAHGQNDTRTQSIKNQLEILSVSTPGLDETLNISISNTSLSTFLLAIADIHGLNVNVDPELESITLINNFPNVSVKDILVFLTQEYELDIRFTGNIMSFKKYMAPTADERVVGVFFKADRNTISFDLKNDKLERVFRKIMDETGKNLLFSPGLVATPLTLYLNDVNLDVGLAKLAETNGLNLTVSRDGFYVFEADYSTNTAQAGAQGGQRPQRRIGRSFYYRVLDSVAGIVEVDLQNTPIADVIYTLSDELGLSVFTASPLDGAGVASVKANAISYDLLLNRIFESAVIDSQTASGTTRGATQSAPTFTFRREDNIYYYGTDDQLTLKQLEVIPLLNRSINILEDPKRSFTQQLNQSFTTGSSRFGVSTAQPATQSGGVQTGLVSTKKLSLETLIPESIREGLIIKTDYQLNSFVVSGPGVQVARFKEFLAQIDRKVPLILIEVMIMEVDRTALVEAGVSFGLGEEPSSTSGSIFPSTDIRLGSDRVNRIIGGFDGFGSLNLGKVLPEFYVDIKANETNGNIKILSTPQLSALNGHKAYLSTSQTTYYTITNQTIIGSQNPQTNTIVNYLPITAELALEFNPFVSADGQITMDVRVVQSSFSGTRIADDAPPDINTREFSSILIMKDQDVAVLGGIEQIIKDDTGSGVPFLARIPVIKWLFSKRRREDTKRNLTVLIKPTVIR
ncbi:type II secretion system protein GspD [Gilvibacter sediminis]|uniref:type II secretion system protein GspD n=1 Tax=Gilvibacter sediminis TaxID=379071 RepID=UPI0023504DD6|nr:type II and III secretion system protein [Gilvibacter sediminis]MDC7996883.1 type II and III secretion system protein [Gilvibacter sediminis]